MGLEDVKERLKSEWQQTSEKLLDNPLVIQIKEKYENLSPRSQKITLLGIGAFIVITALSFPMGYYDQSNNYLEEFTSRRDLLRDLFKAHREISLAPRLSPPVDMGQVQGEVENKSATMKLLPEQIKGAFPINGANKSEISNLISPELIANGMSFQFSKLNLRQIIDMGYAIARNNPNLKMTGIDIKESEPLNPNMRGYFDVSYQVAALNIPAEPKKPMVSDKAQRKINAPNGNQRNGNPRGGRQNEDVEGNQNGNNSDSNFEKENL